MPPDQSNRREFFALVASGAMSSGLWPLAARAQQAGMPLIGFLHSGALEVNAGTLAAFRKGLSETGFVEGRNVAIEYRWANSQYERLPDMVAELIRLRPAVLVLPAGVATALAAKPQTTTIPIVFSMAGDPVALGLVASLNRPGGNITGATDISAELTAKRLGLLHELLPRARRFAVLANPNGPALSAPIVREAQAAAAIIGSEIEVLNASSGPEIAAAFASLVQKRAAGLLIAGDTLFTARRTQIVTLAARHAVPTITSARAFAEAGGLLSYGANASERERLAGLYTGRILKGEKPADLPVVQPTRFEFIINLQTADALGIDVPATLLAQANEVIE